MLHFVSETSSFIELPSIQHQQQRAAFRIPEGRFVCGICRWQGVALEAACGAASSASSFSGLLLHMLHRSSLVQHLAFSHEVLMQLLVWHILNRL